MKIKSSRILPAAKVHLQLKRSLIFLFFCVLAGQWPAIAAEKSSKTEPENVEFAQPVSFQKPSGASNTLRNIRIHSAQIKHSGNAVIGFEHPGIIRLQDGEILVSTEKTTLVKTPHSTCTVSPDTIALISVQNKVTKVRNLWELGHGEIRQTIGDKYVDISAGEESILGWDQLGVNKALARDLLGRRKVRGIEVPGGMFMQRAEIPISTLMQAENSSCLHDLILSQNPLDREIAEKLLKMAAVQTQVTSKHGQFMQMAQPQK